MWLVTAQREHKDKHKFAMIVSYYFKCDQIKELATK